MPFNYNESDDDNDDDNNDDNDNHTQGTVEQCFWWGVDERNLYKIDRTVLTKVRLKIFTCEFSKVSVTILA